MASTIPNRFRTDMLKAVHDLTTATVKVLLLNTSYVANPDHSFVSDLKSPTDYELSGTGYARQTLGSQTVTQDNTNDRGVFDGADVTFTGVNIGTIGMVCVYRDRAGADSANEILAILDNTDLLTNGGNVLVQWSASGIFYFPAP